MWLTQALGRQTEWFMEVGTVVSTDPLQIDVGGRIENIWLCSSCNSYTKPALNDPVLLTCAGGIYICLGILKQADLATQKEV